MNKKITISELSQLLSTNVSLINKKGWEDFLRIFFAQISEGLQAEGNVKIKGLGTFKVVTVDARKSKDVNTGADTVIPAHNKISFTPDSSFAEILNKPYAHFEPTYVLAPEGEVDAPESEVEEETAVEAKAETVVESSPIVETVVEEVKAEAVAEPEPIAESIKDEEKEAPAEKEAPVIEQTVEEEKSETEEATVENITPSAEENTVNEQPSTNQPAAEEDDAEEAEEAEEKEEEDPNADEDESVDTTPTEVAAYASTYKRHDLPTENEEDNDKGHGKRLGIAIILFLCILAVVGFVAWMSDPNIVSKMRSKLTGEDKAKTEIKVDPVELEETKDIEEQIIAEKTEINAEATIALVDSIEKNEAEEAENEEKLAEKPAIVEKTTNFKDDFVEYMKKRHPEMDITEQGDPVEEKLNNASRLTLVSLRHYGAKDFWIYIYLYNKDVIKNPNHIKAGTKIKVPMLDNKRLVNPDSEHSILTAKEIQHAFVK